MLNFVWSHGRHRISCKQLCKPNKEGGYGFPDLHVYYLAAQLRNVVTYLLEPEDLGWFQIENSSVALYILKEVIWESPKKRPKQLTTNPYVLLTIKLWDQSRKLLTSSPSFVFTFLGQSWFPPVASPSSFDLWRRLGICRFCDIATSGGCLSKEALEEKFDTSLLWFQYYQIQNMYGSYYSKFKSAKAMSGFEKLLFKTSTLVRGVISII